MDLTDTEGERDSLRAESDSLRAESTKRISALETALESERDARGREREEASENLRKWEGELITVNEERDEVRQRLREQETAMHTVKETLTSTISSLEKRAHDLERRREEERMALRDTDACIVAGLEKALDEGRRLHAQVMCCLNP